MLVWMLLWVLLWILLWMLLWVSLWMLSWMLLWMRVVDVVRRNDLIATGQVRSSGDLEEAAGT
jgi:hypothetical protein